MALKAKLDGNTTAMEGEDEETLGYPRNGGIFGEVDEHGDIKVSDSDILCGRGGLTNHHLVRKHHDSFLRSNTYETLTFSLLYLFQRETGGFEILLRYTKMIMFERQKWKSQKLHVQL
jgi:hypothetical protein